MDWILISSMTTVRQPRRPFATSTCLGFTGPTKLRFGSWPSHSQFADVLLSSGEREGGCLTKLWLSLENQTFGDECASDGSSSNPIRDFQGPLEIQNQHLPGFWVPTPELNISVQLKFSPRPQRAFAATCSSRKNRFKLWLCSPPQTESSS